MKNLLKAAIGFILALTLAFGMNTSYAHALGINFVCDISQSSICIETLTPESCVTINDDSFDRSHHLLQMSNFNPGVDAHVELSFDGVELDYWIEPDDSINFFFGEATDHKVCNISTGAHPLIQIKYPSFPLF